MRKVMDEKAALDDASNFYDSMCSAETGRRRELAGLLDTELSYLHGATVLQVAAFYLLRQHIPFVERKPAAGNALAFSIFDHLRVGSNALLDNYCLVSMTMARNIFEATLFLTAIGIGVAADYRKQPNAKINEWLEGWWRDKFKPGTVQELITCIDLEMRLGLNDGEESYWSHSAKAIWKIVRSWAHAAWVPIGTSGPFVKPSGEETSTPAISFGGQLIGIESTKLVAYLYSHFAVDALFALRLTFTPQLADYTEWWKRTEELVVAHHQWSQHIDIDADLCR
jgi:hypothetical protein